MQLLRSHEELTYEVLDHSSDTELPIKLQQADALIVRTAKLSPEMLEKATRLRVVARHGVGYDNVPVDVLSRNKTPLATTGDANAVTVAEHAFYLILTLAKREENLTQPFGMETGNRVTLSRAQNYLERISYWWGLAASVEKSVNEL